MKKKMTWVKRANYVLGIIQSTENLADIKTEMAHLKKIEVDNVKYKTGIQPWWNKNKTWTVTEAL